MTGSARRRSLRAASHGSPDRSAQRNPASFTAPATDLTTMLAQQAWRSRRTTPALSIRGASI